MLHLTPTSRPKIQTFVPENLLVVVGCGCRRKLNETPSDELRCTSHETRGGWKFCGDPVIVAENEIHAIEDYKAGHFDQACYSIDCLNFRIPGPTEYGYCKACANIDVNRRHLYRMIADLNALIADPQKKHKPWARLPRWMQNAVTAYFKLRWAYLDQKERQNQDLPF